jgi:diguanylate cyclase (GGDEF)-like protein
MADVGDLQLSFLDGPTLAFVTVCIVALLGLFLILAWLQQRDMRALAWWGSAYLIGASSLALWAAPSQWIELPREMPFAMIFVACGMIWNGVRLFGGRRVLPVAAFAGAVVWLVLCQLPLFTAGSTARTVLGVLVVATYTFFIALELSRERRKSLRSRIAIIAVPWLHAAIFLMPLAIRALTPEVVAASWVTVFALETVLYAVGTAFIVLLLVKDHSVGVYRHAASTDFLTGLLNRRAFLENALMLCARQAKGNKPVTLMMFDLDHFKSINDRFGHAVGDRVLQVFVEAACTKLGPSDLIGRLGGEEFAIVIYDSGRDKGLAIAERIRLAFEDATVEVDGRQIGGTLSMGMAIAETNLFDIPAVLAQADEALYCAKERGRNRVEVASLQLMVERAKVADQRGRPAEALAAVGAA